MTIKPIGQRILVKPQNKEDKTVGGILLPLTMEQEAKSIGEIIAVGNDVTQYKVGDKVIYGKYSGDEIEADNEQYKMLYIGFQRDESDVLAIISE